MQPTNPVYQILSGVRVTPDTRFLSRSDPEDLSLLSTVHRYMHFAIGVYGWPMYLRRRGNGCLALCDLCGSMRGPTSLAACCCCSAGADEGGGSGRRTRGAPPDDPTALHAATVVEDNCCGCNRAAYSILLGRLNGVREPETNLTNDQ